ncbi:MAG: tetraacyldisaccharide 4'-kinase [Hyphomicrobiaceae bacterium]|nr:tetraacyldisaccharide 4'-kinase [Hyphomicrobiaceae bacterium]
MPFKEPSWWYNSNKNLAARTLQPLSKIYGTLSQRYFLKLGAHKSPLPVICVGNFTAGGTGKTPLAILLSKIVRKVGGQPVFLSRGYRSRVTTPHKVSLLEDKARDVGDEPLVLARHAEVTIARDRLAGANFIEHNELGNVIIMDDGLQNSSLHKDLTIAVIDGKRGIGNGLTMPAGPLRAPIEAQLLIPHVFVIYGKPLPNTLSLVKSLPQPILYATSKPVGDLSWITQKSLFAFSGIGNPERFYDLLKILGGQIIEKYSFSDHHSYTVKEARRLLQKSNRLSAQLVTTEKDIVRFDAHLSEAHNSVRKISKVLQVQTDMSQANTTFLQDLIIKVLHQR